MLGKHCRRVIVYVFIAVELLCMYILIAVAELLCMYIILCFALLPPGSIKNVVFKLQGVWDQKSFSVFDKLLKTVYLNAVCNELKL